MDPNVLIDKISECMQKLRTMEDYIHQAPIIVAEVGDQQMVTHSANSNESISIHKKVLENIRKKVNEYRLNKAMIAGDEA